MIKITLASVFAILLLINGASTFVQADQIAIRLLGNPTTPGYYLSLFLSNKLNGSFEERKISEYLAVDPKSEQYFFRVEMCAYYLLQSIEQGVNDPQNFNVALSLWKKGYQRLCGRSFPECSTDDLVGLRNQLLLTKTGQQFLRFPRIYLDKENRVIVRFPYSELYSQTEKEIVLTKNSEMYSTYLKCLQRENFTHGKEFVVVDIASPTFDWDHKGGAKN